MSQQPNSTGDEDLVDAARAGDRGAFDKLALRHQDRLYNAVKRMSGDAADAADITQGALLRAWTGLSTFDGRARFSTWLFRIAVNLTFAERRRGRGRRMYSLHDTNGHAPVAHDVSADPRETAVDRTLTQRELQESIARALARVPEEFRAPLVLRDLEGLDYAAISEVLDVPIGTVKSRIFRGRMLLRDLLAPQVMQDDRQSA